MHLRTRIDAVGWQRFARLSLMAALLLLVTAWIAFSLNAAARRHFEQSAMALRGVDAARDYLQAALDAESGARSYVLTGEIAYLEPYQHSRDRLAKARAELRERIGSEHTLEPRILAMDRAANDALTEMQTAISLYREQGPDVVVEYLRGGFGKDLMDRARGENAAISMALTAHGRAELESMQAARLRRDFSAALALLLGLACGVGAFLVIREHTLALQDEHRLRLRAEQAMRESTEKSVFLANMSHEIRTPMNAIFGFTELLDDLVTGTRERHYVRAIRSSGESLLALINDILDLSRIESGRIDLRPEATDIRELLNATATMFAEQIAAKSLRLDIHLAPGLDQALHLDPLRVRQVIFNLVSNAIKYTDHGHIELHASLAPDGPLVQLQIAVRDTGLGIAAADQARIFEPFTQLDLADRARRGGTGLGLSIVRRLMDAMGGEIRVYSVAGRGSTFTATWPRLAVATTAPPPSAAPIALADIRPLKLLAIDDHALNRSLLLSFFAEGPHQLEVYADAPSGLARLHALRPDVVLLDLRMPGMDGREALQQIRDDPQLRSLYVLAVTASNLLDEDADLYSAFDGYVRKPLTREALSAELARLFGKHPAANAPLAHPPLRLDGLDASARARGLIAIEAIGRRCARAKETLSTQSLSELQQQIEVADSWIVEQFAASLTHLRGARERFDLAAMENALDEIAASCEKLEYTLQPPQDQA